ncbi:MAG: tRNA lysidine(34) synthetase TilS [Candidatus Omnitrophota bacterium]|nr:tRNA lysidine(34) synthetase TilS [Candidatus Omnitrophota bacterium]
MTRKRGLTASAFRKRVKDTIKHYDMLHEGDRVLAAVSGGADSVCMLKVLLDLRAWLETEIIVANVDHCLRGKESEADSMFVKKMSKRLGLKFVHKKVNVRSGSGKGKSIEERSRERRYEFLKVSARRNGCNVIATGHTMDDQAETVLMRIVHGSSLAGVSGIYPVRHEGSLRIVRPLIRVGRGDILDFLQRTELKHVEDSSNLDVKFLRNSVRHEILPFLEKYNPKLKRTLANFSDTIREDLAFINRAKEKAVKRYAERETSALAVRIRDIILQPAALKKEIFKELFRKAGGNVKKLTYRHWMDMDYFLRAAEKSKSLDFPGDIRVTRRRDEIVFGKRKRRKGA